MKPVFPEQVDKIISNLKNTNSFGLDMIDTSAIKLVRNEVLPPITHMINLSIVTKKFPTEWKKSKIVPLHKNDDALNPKNCRPVAIVPVLSKMLDSQIIDYLDENDLIHPNHHAYRSDHNTATTMVQMYDNWINMI